MAAALLKTEFVFHINLDHMAVRQWVIESIRIHPCIIRSEIFLLFCYQGYISILLSLIFPQPSVVLSHNISTFSVRFKERYYTFWHFHCCSHSNDTLTRFEMSYCQSISVNSQRISCSHFALNYCLAQGVLQKLVQQPTALFFQTPNCMNFQMNTKLLCANYEADHKVYLSMPSTINFSTIDSVLGTLRTEKQLFLSN